MDQRVIDQLQAASLATNPGDLELGLHRNEHGLAVLTVGTEANELSTALKPCSELFTGDRQPPSLEGEPPDEYLDFFVILESTLARACALDGHAQTDDEVERLFRYLKKRPDGVDRNPIFAVLQQAARLYMSLRPTSRAEYEAVMDRLSRSARTFSLGKGSRNYYLNVLVPLLGAD